MSHKPSYSVVLVLVVTSPAELAQVTKRISSLLSEKPLEAKAPDYPRIVAVDAPDCDGIIYSNFRVFKSTGVARPRLLREAERG